MNWYALVPRAPGREHHHDARTTWLFRRAHRPRAVRFVFVDVLDAGERNRPPPTQVRGVLGGPMSMQEGNVVSIRIIPNEQDHPPGKLADAQVIFEADAGPLLSGLKLSGFGIWERRGGGKYVSFPARQFSTNGTRRSFVLLRPSGGDTNAQDPLRRCILDAYDRLEAHACDSERVRRMSASAARPPVRPSN